MWGGKLSGGTVWGRYVEGEMSRGTSYTRATYTYMHTVRVRQCFMAYGRYRPLLLCPRHTYQKSVPKTGTRKPVPVSGASDAQFGTEFFWYHVLVTNKVTMLYRGVCVTGISQGGSYSFGSETFKTISAMRASVQRH